MSAKKYDAVSAFKIVSFLEGVSYVLLLFVAVPIKYLLDNATLVKLLGMPHGVLFMLYIVMALFICRQMKWSWTTTAIVLAASLFPFGTFYINKKHFGSYI